jgi:hypothetical protein
VCILLLLSAHGNAGAASARLSLRPLIERADEAASTRAKTCRGIAKPRPHLHLALRQKTCTLHNAGQPLE